MYIYIYITQGYDCRIEFLPLTIRDGGASLSTWTLGQGVAPVYTLALPSGAVGLGWDPDAQDFLVGFNGASDGNMGNMKRAGRLLEDRMFIFGKPILKTVKPGGWPLQLVCRPVPRHTHTDTPARLVGNSLSERRNALPHRASVCGAAISS
jgi:hypothetical protein